MSSSSAPKKTAAISVRGAATYLLVACAGFYGGLVAGSSHHGVQDCSQQCQEFSNGPTREIRDRLAKLKEYERKERLDSEVLDKETSSSGGERFPTNVAEFAVGLSQVDRDSFTKRFDVGVPLDVSANKNDRVVILYNDVSSLPNDKTIAHKIQGSDDLPLLQIEQATENCDILNLILVQPKARRQCFAMMGQYQSFHIQKWMRLPVKDGERLDPKAPLRLVSRGDQASGRKSAKLPTRQQTLEYWSTLKVYLDTFESVLEKLKPYVERVAKENTVVVLVCNHGQSELLMNFVCASQARGLDLSAVLVFATDEETKELAEGLGLTAFYDETNYGNAPKRAARAYGDKTFAAMMMAKIYCVQMVSMLGYDVLFQDVDIVWYREPLSYFHDENSPSHGFDIYFQDDGNRGIFYAPFSANTGFYYVRSNDRTRHFFNSLLLAGDLVISSKSHQIALVALLNEHTSLYGLKTKVLSRDTTDFPGGHAFHYKRDFMKQIFAGEVVPYLFHMSWTLNKDNKQKFFKQSGMWYLEEKCVAKTGTEILGEGVTIQKNSLLEHCCSAEPIITCFYSDKPSKIPCKDSPTIDKNGRPFWK